jgi:hypothetical protein
MSDDSTSDTEALTLRSQVHESRSRLVKGLLVVVGFVSVGLGILGVVLPILPTTPFLLLAAACFAHSSERFYVWLLTNRVFGSYIRDWRENRGLTIPVKLWVIFVLAVTMGISVVFFVPVPAVKVVLILIGLGISAYIWRLPTKPAGGE